LLKGENKYGKELTRGECRKKPSQSGTTNVSFILKKRAKMPLLVFVQSCISVPSPCLAQGINTQEHLRTAAHPDGPYFGLWEIFLIPVGVELFLVKFLSS
jgi:hypothetical protein